MNDELDLSPYAYDTPARVAVIGGGPVGVEAALYARYLGYSVSLYEAGLIGESLLRTAHIRWFTPFGKNASPLGIAALRAQESSWKCPAAEEMVRAGEFVERYLRPLAASDLLEESIKEQTRVVSITRGDYSKGELLPREARREQPFRLLLKRGDQESLEEADIVIDASGVFSNPRACGVGGAKLLLHGAPNAADPPEPASSKDAQISRGTLHGRPVEGWIRQDLPDFETSERASFAGKHVLLVGGGFSAATNLLALAQVAKETGARVTWVVRREGTPGRSFPLPIVEDDKVPARRQLADEANRWAAQAGTGSAAWLRLLCGHSLESAEQRGDGGWDVILGGDSRLRVEQVDVLLANVGFQPDLTMLRELQVSLCYASEAPMNLAKQLLSVQNADCMAIPSFGASSLITTEPDFYILGSKSYGRSASFLLATGLRQIVDVFALIGGRAGLDLHKTMAGSSQ